MKNTIYGYVRVSSAGQKEDRQLLAMRQERIPEQNIFIDMQSGRDFQRPKYQELVARHGSGACGSAGRRSQCR